MFMSCSKVCPIGTKWYHPRRLFFRTNPSHSWRWRMSSGSVTDGPVIHEQRGLTEGRGHRCLRRSCIFAGDGRTERPARPARWRLYYRTMSPYFSPGRSHGGSSDLRVKTAWLRHIPHQWTSL